LEKKLSEEKLIELLRKGDQSAFTYLYNNYSSTLYGVLLKIISDEEIAADVLQESMVKIWKNFTMYDSTKGRLFTWMINIARNMAIDKMRSKFYKQSSKTLNIEKSVSWVDRNKQTEFRPEHIGLRQLVEKMKPELREILDLVYFNGFTQAETAVALDIPLGTVKTRMRAAINQLRQLV